MHNTITIKHTHVIPTNIDHIPSNTTHSGSSAMLYVFEDNETVIKMILKGRSPTMRHVSRTHRVASLCREKMLPRDQKGTCIKGWIQSNARFGPVSDIKVCNQYGRYSFEVQVQSLFEDQTESWDRLGIGIDKFVREAMPIQRKRKLR